MPTAAAVTKEEVEVVECDMDSDRLAEEFLLTHPIIELTPEEREVADRLGKHRNDKAEKDGHKADWTDNRGGGVIENHQDGVAAEMCHLRYLGVSLSDFETKYYRIDTFKQPDVGFNTEVRSTKMPPLQAGGKVKDRDENHRIVVFYRKKDQLRFQILGWLTVAEAKAVGEYLDPGDRGIWAYFVRDNQMHSPQTIPQDRGV